MRRYIRIAQHLVETHWSRLISILRIMFIFTVSLIESIHKFSCRCYERWVQVIFDTEKKLLTIIELPLRKFLLVYQTSQRSCVQAASLNKKLTFLLQIFSNFKLAYLRQFWPYEADMVLIRCGIERRFQKSPQIKGIFGPLLR